ncbi:hypothetical protein [Amycolatopsis taiwanensis]|uniref:hypothetical protein n=1 Tax=Amycolatopsis taiwanensis TaxID=342230 RepID=UPI000483D369|nr:hypothetical protein [Amycolatopsis taiwanensis]
MSPVQAREFPVQAREFPVRPGVSPVQALEFRLPNTDTDGKPLALHGMTAQFRVQARQPRQND